MRKNIMIVLATALVVAVVVFTGMRSLAGPGYGPGWMMGWGGQGYGPGMMASGGGYGPGWMMHGYGGGYGPGMMYGYGQAKQSDLNLTVDQVKQYLGQMIRNPNLTVGEVKEKDVDTIVAEIVPKQGNGLV